MKKWDGKVETCAIVDGGFCIGMFDFNSRPNLDYQKTCSSRKIGQVVSDDFRSPLIALRPGSKQQRVLLFLKNVTTSSALGSQFGVGIKVRVHPGESTITTLEPHRQRHQLVADHEADTSTS